MGSSMKKLTPDLMVADVKQSVDFYVNILGFTLDMVVSEEVAATKNNQIIETKIEEGKNYVYAMVHRDEVFVMFMHQEAYRKDIPTFLTVDVGASVAFYIEMENVKDFYHEIKDKVVIEKELADTWYGMREFYIKDNNGYILAFAERINKILEE